MSLPPQVHRTASAFLSAISVSVLAKRPDRARLAALAVAHLHGELVESPAEAGEPDAVEWCVLGVSRLHHLLAAGSLTSRRGAGRYALTAIDPRRHPIVLETSPFRESHRIR